MAKLGKRVVFHDPQHGDMVGWLVNEDGTQVAGFTNTKAAASGDGDVFRRNASEGDNPGEYTLAGK